MSAPSEPFAFHPKATRIPAEPGAYVVLIELAAPLTITLPKRAPVELAPGRYLYCGSANGGGGMKARLARHLRRRKTVRWHVDQLTTKGRAVGAWVVPGGNECGLVALLGDLPVPIPGFGSSDCRACRSHLLYWPPEMVLPSCFRATGGKPEPL